MMNFLTKKWWLMLLQGVLMIVLSIYIFNNPIVVLKGVSLWLGIMVAATGILGIIDWFMTDAEEEEKPSLFWNILTLLFGLFLLMNLILAMKAVGIIFGIWMLSTSIWLFGVGNKLRKDSFFGWVLLFIACFSVLASMMIIFNLGVAAIGLSTLLGMQMFLTGTAMIFLSIFKKRIVKKLKNL